MTNQIPVHLISDPGDAACASSREEMFDQLVSRLFVQLPEQPAAGGVAYGPAPPGPDSPARVWVRTAQPTFVAALEDGVWVARVGQGTLVPFTEFLPTNSVYVELSPAAVAVFGLAGRWAQVTFPPITGVRYL